LDCWWDIKLSQQAGHGRRHAKLFFGEADVETANGSGEAYL